MRKTIFRHQVSRILHPSIYQHTFSKTKNFPPHNHKTTIVSEKSNINTPILCNKYAFNFQISPTVSVFHSLFKIIQSKSWKYEIFSTERTTMKVKRSRIISEWKHFCFQFVVIQWISNYIINITYFYLVP